MVSKAAVIAIVAILAVPILLGYALNVEQVTETDYKTTGDPVNVTQLLQTGTDYTYAHADSYQLNTNFRYFGSAKNIIPNYSSGPVDYKTSMPAQEYSYGDADYTREVYPAGSYPMAKGPLSTYKFMFLKSNITNTSSGYLNLTIYDLNDSPLITKTQIASVYWSMEDSMVYLTRYSSGYLIQETIHIADPNQSYQFTATGNYTDTGYLIRQHNVISGAYTYIDLSKGWRLYPSYTGPRAMYPGEDYDNLLITMPTETRSAILTIDLDSITEDNYSLGLGEGQYLEKTTNGGEVSWQIKQRDRALYTVPTTDLYYDPNGNNTYQVKVWVDPNPKDRPGFNDPMYDIHFEFRYVGAWPSLFGEANYFKSYDIVNLSLTPRIAGFAMLVGGYSDHTPIMRVDDAEFRAMEYQIISDKTYDPAAFKTNPATTINDPTVYGASFTFGGNTYTVSKGNITLGTHDIPVKGLVLSSVPNPEGGYDNKIGNTVISTTAAPSAITFNGKWSATITTSAQEEYEITKTEWKAGDFAWDGIDHNFIMAGLLASLGAFVGVGIYARRTKSSVWPLLIVCGGAALLFFVML